MKLPVMEIFGPTIQGEGMVIGQKTMFVRTAGCDYSCDWCDSSFTWDGTGKSTLLEVDAIIKKLKEIGGQAFSHITISGGNPVIHKGIGALIDAIHREGWKAAIETQGSIWQEWLTSLDEVTISPKPPSSKMETNYEQLDYFIQRLTENKSNFSLKVVVFNDEDFAYAEEIHRRYKQVPFFIQVGNRHITEVDGQKLNEQLLTSYEWLIDKTIKSEIMNDAKVLPQLHALVWGNKRGV